MEMWTYMEGINQRVLAPHEYYRINVWSGEDWGTDGVGILEVPG